MKVPDTWHAARRRTNRVRAVGLVVGVLAGLPLGGFAAILVVAGLDGLTEDPAWGARLWCLVGVATLLVSLRTLWVMPAMTPRGRTVGLCAALAGTLTAAPVVLFPWPWRLGGIALVATGLALAIELTKQARDERVGAEETVR